MYSYMVCICVYLYRDLSKKLSALVGLITRNHSIKKQLDLKSGIIYFAWIIIFILHFIAVKVFCWDYFEQKKNEVNNIKSNESVFWFIEIHLNRQTCTH